eukprot:m.83233 g.83233  ORF g.83233 m.83233 type:complete len:415 (+) comp14964_c0_seq1:236-1480(+)
MSSRAKSSGSRPIPLVELQPSHLVEETSVDGHINGDDNVPLVLTSPNKRGGPATLAPEKAKKMATLLEWDGPHIVQYSAAKLFRHDFFIMRGTVFDLRQRFAWIQLVFLTLVSLVVAVYQVKVADVETGEAESDHWWDHLNSASTMVNNMVVFLLGFYTTQVINRWWDLRMALSGLHTSVRDVSLLTATYLSPVDAKPLREAMVRYCNVLHAMTFKLHNIEEDWSDLLEKRFLTEDEVSALKGVSSPTMTVCHWCSTLVVKAVAEKLLLVPESSVTLLQNGITSLRETTSRINTMVECQLPFPYVHLLTVIVKVALLTLAASQGQQAGSLYLRRHPTWIVFLALRLILMNFFYQGLLELQVILANPFQQHPAHFPRQTFIDRVERDTRTIIRHPELVPFSMSAVSHDQELRKRI